MQQLRPKYVILADNVSSTDLLLVGHTKVRCKEPPKEDDAGFGGGDAGGGFDSVPAAADGGDDWGPVASQPELIAAGGESSW